MLPSRVIQSGTKGRRTAILIALVAAVLSVPVMIHAFGANPPLGYTSAPGQGTCASCHGTLTSGSGVTVNPPSTYTPGGAAVSMTVTIPSTGGFELAILTQSGNSQAGTLAAGPPPPNAAFPQDAVSTVATIQYIYSTVETTSWTFSWTPPATNIGNVVLYVTGGSHSPNYSNSYVITPSAPPPPPNTLAVSPTSLTFNVSGVEPPAQSILVTSGGTSIPIATGVSTSNAGSWLTVMPPGGNTPVSATVGIVATGLATGTYFGSVSFSSASANNSPISVPVTLNVITPLPPPVPTLDLSAGPLGLTFTATAGGTAPSAQNLMVTTSDGSAVTFNAAPTSTGNWLTVGGSTGTSPGTTPASESIGVVLTGLAAGTYNGHVTLTSSAVSNSPVTLPVTLTVNSSTPPPPPCGGEHFSLVVVDRQSGGSDWLLLDGRGSVNSSGTPSGSGFFTRFRSGSTGGSTTIVSSGTWKPSSVTSCTPVSGGEGGGTLVLEVQITTDGASTASSGTLTITHTGTTEGATLAINGGATFVSVGIGDVDLQHSHQSDPESGRFDDSQR